MGRLNEFPLPTPGNAIHKSLKKLPFYFGEIQLGCLQSAGVLGIGDIRKALKGGKGRDSSMDASTLSSSLALRFCANGGRA